MVPNKCIHKNQRIIHAAWECWWECPDCTALVKKVEPGDVERYERETEQAAADARQEAMANR